MNHKKILTKKSQRPNGLGQKLATKLEQKKRITKVKLAITMMSRKITLLSKRTWPEVHS